MPVHTDSAHARGSALAHPPAPDALAGLSTRFDTPAALAVWREHRVEGWAPKWDPPRVEGGSLVLRPRSSGWFEDNQAGHLYRVVEGDFIVTAALRVSGTRGGLPTRSFSLAGLLVRAPRELPDAAAWKPGREDWVFFSAGTAFPAGEPHFEVKTTARSLSTLRIHPAPEVAEGWVRLRMARQGELFTLLARGERGEWRMVDQLIRPDLPARLHVGLTAYADWDGVAPDYPDYRRYNERGARTEGADLVARVRGVEFRRPATGRFAVATLDPRLSFDRTLAAARLADLTRD